MKIPSGFRSGLVLLAYGFVLATVQATVTGSLSFRSAAPDLALVLAVLAGYRYGSREGALAGLAAGFFRDYYTGQVLGVGMLSLMYMGLLASVLFHRWLRKNLLVELLQVALLTLVFQAGLHLLLFLFPPLAGVPYTGDDLLLALRLRILPSVPLNLAAALPIHAALHVFGPYRRRREEIEDRSADGFFAWDAQ